MAEDEAEIIEWVKQRPLCEELTWTCDFMDKDKDFVSSWVDIILAPEHMRELHMGWVWTLLDMTDDEEEHAIWCFDYPKDLWCFRNCSWSHHEEIASPIGTYPNAEDVAKLQAAHDADPESVVMGYTGWSHTRISEALNWWSAEFAGRPDLRFVWNPELPPSPMAQDALGILEGIKSGAEEKYLLIPGEAEGETGLSVYASEQVMDFLLNLATEDE